MYIETDNNYSFPDPYINPKEKGKPFIMKYGRGMYHTFRKSGANIFFNARNDIREQIAYATGRQSSDQYKQRLDCWNDKNKSWMNLDWQILNLCSRFVNVVVGKLNKNEHQAVCTAIDALAMDQRREYKAKLDTLMELRAWMDNIGVESSQYFADVPEIDLDPAEIEIDLNMTLKHRWCMRMEQLIEKVLTKNKYKQLKRELDWDAVVNGVKVLKITDIRENFPVLEKVNPENFITTYTEFEDFRDIQNAGEVKMMSPGELFKRAGSDFTEDEKKDIMERFVKNKPIYSHDEARDYSRAIDESEAQYIEVLDFCFLSPDELVFEKKKDKRGNAITYKKGYNFPEDPEEYEKKYGKERKVTRIQYNALYKGLWIVGSNYLCDYGRVENSMTDDCYDNVIPYIIHAPNMKDGEPVSMVRQMIPILNMIQLNWLRFNDAIAKYIPKGAFLDLDALEDVAIGKGGKNLTKREIIDLYFKRGLLAGRRKNMANKGAHGMPIEELENGMSKDTQNFFNNILQGIMLLRDIIGVNEVTDASTPDPKMLKTLAEAAQAGTNNALDYLYHADNIGFESLCYKLSYSIIGAIKRGVDPGVEESVGKGVIKFFGENSDITAHKYAFKIENKPTKEEWIAFYEDVQIALANKQILPSDAAFIKEIDNLKQARQYLIVKERRKARMDAEQQQASIEATAQAQQASAATTSKLKENEIKLEYQGEKEIEAMKLQNVKTTEEEKRKTLQMQYDLELRNKKELLQLEGAIKSGHLAQEAIQDIEIEAAKPKEKPANKAN